MSGSPTSSSTASKRSLAAMSRAPRPVSASRQSKDSTSRSCSAKDWRSALSSSTKSRRRFVAGRSIAAEVIRLYRCSPEQAPEDAPSGLLELGEITPPALRAQASPLEGVERGQCGEGSAARGTDEL